MKFKNKSKIIFTILSAASALTFVGCNVTQTQDSNPQKDHSATVDETKEQTFEESTKEDEHSQSAQEKETSKESESVTQKTKEDAQDSQTQQPQQEPSHETQTTTQETQESQIIDEHTPQTPKESESVTQETKEDAQDSQTQQPEQESSQEAQTTTKEDAQPQQPEQDSSHESQTTTQQTEEPQTPKESESATQEPEQDTQQQEHSSAKESTQESATEESQKPAQESSHSNPTSTTQEWQLNQNLNTNNNLTINAPASFLVNFNLSNQNFASQTTFASVYNFEDFTVNNINITYYDDQAGILKFNANVTKNNITKEFSFVISGFKKPQSIRSIGYEFDTNLMYQNKVDQHSLVIQSADDTQKTLAYFKTLNGSSFDNEFYDIKNLILNDQIFIQEFDFIIENQQLMLILNLDLKLKVLDNNIVSEKHFNLINKKVSINTSYSLLNYINWVAENKTSIKQNTQAKNHFPSYYLGRFKNEVDLGHNFVSLDNEYTKLANDYSDVAIVSENMIADDVTGELILKFVLQMHNNKYDNDSYTSSVISYTIDGFKNLNNDNILKKFNVRLNQNSLLNNAKWFNYINAASKEDSIITAQNNPNLLNLFSKIILADNSRETLDLPKMFLVEFDNTSITNLYDPRTHLIRQTLNDPNAFMPYRIELNVNKIFNINANENSIVFDLESELIVSVANNNGQIKDYSLPFNFTNVTITK
ncbi:lipoprotein 17-related variable surface protein [Mycoplasmopsis ciconiae]|uniref:Lipoprotein 17-related variable surface protein n=1 Tax=Mycoplasmopsis ciconiae TaxID=561067 RepID=A0ABU7ML04_9BACT|nr:lipoprotein 17-related variable surface protein [Mycoplasmopsis ciconiae]